MPSIIVPRGRTQQPRELIKLNYSNALTTNLISTILPYYRTDLSGKAIFDSSSGSRVSARYLGERYNNSQYSVYFPNYSAPQKITQIIFVTIHGSGTTYPRISNLTKGNTTNTGVSIYYHYASSTMKGLINNGVVQTIGTNVYTLGAMHAVALRYDESSLSLFLDGKKESSSVSGSINYSSGGPYVFRLNKDAAANYGDTEVHLNLIYNTALSDSAVLSISKNPWQLFKPRKQVLYFDVSTGLPTLSNPLLINPTVNSLTPRVSAT